MSRQHYEEILLSQEQEALHIAALASIEIENAFRICGLEMLNEALKGSGVHVIASPLPVQPSSEIPAPFGDRYQH
ncbi:hypothetical protein QWJ07_03885 [Frankia sp. RB7]|nr:hypothetical protein [Frankia sp. RB7]